MPAWTFCAARRAMTPSPAAARATTSAVDLVRTAAPTTTPPKVSGILPGPESARRRRARALDTSGVILERTDRAPGRRIIRPSGRGAKAAQGVWGDEGG